jgi:hypothetical protein
MVKNLMAKKIQNAFIRWRQMQKIRLFFRAIRLMQALWKVRMDRKRFLRIRASVRKLQPWFRRRAKRLIASKLRKTLHLMKTYIERYIDQKRFMLGQKAIITIQRAIKKSLVKMRLKRNNKIKRQIVIFIYSFIN